MKLVHTNEADIRKAAFQIDQYWDQVGNAEVRKKISAVKTHTRNLTQINTNQSPTFGKSSSISNKSTISAEMKKRDKSPRYNENQQRFITSIHAQRPKIDNKNKQKENIQAQKFNQKCSIETQISKDFKDLQPDLTGNNSTLHLTMEDSFLNNLNDTVDLNKRVNKPIQRPQYIANSRISAITDGYSANSSLSDLKRVFEEEQKQNNLLSPSMYSSKGKEILIEDPNINSHERKNKKIITKKSISPSQPLYSELRAQMRKERKMQSQDYLCQTQTFTPSRLRQPTNLSNWHQNQSLTNLSQRERKLKFKNSEQKQVDEEENAIAQAQGVIQSSIQSVVGTFHREISKIQNTKNQTERQFQQRKLLHDSFKKAGESKIQGLQKKSDSYDNKQLKISMTNSTIIELSMNEDDDKYIIDKVLQDSRSTTHSTKKSKLTDFSMSSIQQFYQLQNKAAQIIQQYWRRKN